MTDQQVADFDSSPIFTVRRKQWEAPMTGAEVDEFRGTDEPGSHRGEANADAAACDRQIEADILAGRLDAIPEKVKDEFANRQTSKL